MFDYTDVWYNVVADMEQEPLFEGVFINLAVDVNETLYSDTTREQDDAINAARAKYARALEREVADILGAIPIGEED
jgi:hypothetical protein